MRDSKSENAEEGNLQAASKEVDKKAADVSVRSIAKKYGIPSSTLHDHLLKKDTRIGADRQTILTPEEEREIVYSCQVLQEIGFGLTRDIVGAIVIDYLSTIGRDNPFNGKPGPRWWRGFQTRFPQLVNRKPQHLPKHQAIAGNQATIQGFFAKVKDLLRSQKLFDVETWQIGCGIAMKVESALRLYPAPCWQEEEASGSMRQQGDLDVKSPPSMPEGQLQEGAYHHLLFTKENTCIHLGRKEDQKVLYFLFLRVDGWRKQTFSAGLLRS